MKRKPLSSPKSLRWLLLTNLVVILVALSLPTTVYADDCLKDPFNAADCMRTGGYRQALVVTFATLPTISVIIPNLLQAPVNVLPPILQSQFGPAVQPPEQLPVVPQQAGPSVNDQGQVWYQPPWDQGGPYWVDPKEYDNIQQHLQNGYQWSDRWGWKPPEEISQLDQQRDQRWKKFTSKEEGLKRHEQLKRDIQKDLENDPEYQRVQRELAEIKNRLDDIKRQGIRDEMEFYQRQAQMYNRQADYYDNLSLGAQIVKTTADVSIEVLSLVPGVGQGIKHAYKTTAKAAETYAETGDGYKAVASGGLELAKSYYGDKFNKSGAKAKEYAVEFFGSGTQKFIEKGNLPNDRNRKSIS